MLFQVPTHCKSGSKADVTGIHSTNRVFLFGQSDIDQGSRLESARPTPPMWGSGLRGRSIPPGQYIFEAMPATKVGRGGVAASEGSRTVSLLTKVRRQAEPGLECLADKARAIVTPVELRRGQGAGFYVNQSLFQGAGPRRETFRGHSPPNLCPTGCPPAASDEGDCMGLEWWVTSG